jgi:outer membrane lipoprotein carrier protein
MKNGFLSIMMLAVLFTVSAQPPKGMGKNDAAAKKLLDGVSAKFKSFKSFQANFLLQIENGNGKSMGSKTGMLQMKGSRYKITVPGQEIFSDGTNIWTYEKGANEVTITKFDPTVNSITPQKLFTNFYDKDFLYKLNGEVKAGGKKYQEVELTPIDKTKPFHKVMLQIDKAMIYVTKVFEKSGNRYTYSINNLKTGAVMTDQSFVFDPKKYPGVEVVDLR